MNLPSFIVAGGHKCASTSLHQVLGRHPQIAISKEKEPHYFARESLASRLVSGVWDREQYRALWSGAPYGNLLGEVSPLYLYYADEVVSAIKQEMSEPPRVIVSVRNPIERAYSSYCDVSLKNPHEPAASFSEAVKRQIERGPHRTDGVHSPTLSHLALGFYTAGLETFSKALGRENLHVVVFDDLSSSPEATVRAMEDFLEVDHSPDIADATRVNTGRRQWRSTVVGSAMRATPLVRARRLVKRVAPAVHKRVVDGVAERLAGPAEQMSRDTRLELVEVYRDEVLALSEFVGQDLNDWLSVP